MDDESVEFNLLVIILFAIGTCIAIGTILLLVFVFEMIATVAAQTITLM